MIRQQKKTRNKKKQPQSIWLAKNVRSGNYGMKKVTLIDVDIDRRSAERISEEILATDGDHGFDYDFDKCPEPGKNADVIEQALQDISSDQTDYVVVIVKDSEQVEVLTEDLQVALQLQALLQAALALILTIGIGDDNQANRIMLDMMSRIKETQHIRKVICVDNSFRVQIRVTSTELAFNLQLLLQLLASLLVKLEVA